MLQPPYNAKMKILQKDPLDLNDINLRSRRVFQKEDSPTVIKEQYKKEANLGEIKESWTTFGGEQPLDLEIEKISTMLIIKSFMCLRG